MNFAEARAANDEKLLPLISQIECGQAVDALGPFAKAYLGMFLNFEVGIGPEERIFLLANKPLANAVLQGFDAALAREDFPSAREIGKNLTTGEYPLIGYVVRAGMDRVCAQSLDDVMALPDTTLQSALCFHYANASCQPDRWFSYLIARRPDLASISLRDFWLGMIEAGADSLTGLHQFLGKQQYETVMRKAVLPLLQAWPDCRASDLYDLLMAALQFADEVSLLAIARERLAGDRIKDVKRRNYWMATAFLLSPDEYAQPLALYAGSSKEKVLPLLDFTYNVLTGALGHKRSLTPVAYAQLLRVIGPTFPPLDIDGRLDEISRKVIWLFKQMVAPGGEEAAEAIRLLRKVRVMKVCKHILDHIEALLADRK